MLRIFVLFCLKHRKIKVVLIKMLENVIIIKI